MSERDESSDNTHKGQVRESSGWLSRCVLIGIAIACAVALVLWGPWNTTAREQVVEKHVGLKAGEAYAIFVKEGSFRNQNARMPEEGEDKVGSFRPPRDAGCGFAHAIFRPPTPPRPDGRTESSK